MRRLVRRGDEYVPDERAMKPNLQFYAWMGGTLVACGVAWGSLKVQVNAQDDQATSFGLSQRQMDQSQWNGISEAKATANETKTDVAVIKENVENLDEKVDDLQADVKSVQANQQAMSAEQAYQRVLLQSIEASVNRKQR